MLTDVNVEKTYKRKYNPILIKEVYVTSNQLRMKIELLPK